MDSKKSPKWKVDMLKILSGANAKISLSLTEEKSIISIYSDENKAKLISTSSNEVKILVGESYREKRSRDEIVEMITNEIEEKGLIDSRKIEKALNGEENLFGAFVKLEALLKKNSKGKKITTRKIGRNRVSQEIQRT